MTEPTFHDLESDWPEIAAGIDELLGDFSPGQVELGVVLDAQRENIGRLASRVTKSTTTPEQRQSRLREAVTDLVLIQIYQKSEDAGRKRLLVQALWDRLDPTIRCIGRQILGGIRRIASDDRLDDLMQDAYLVFEEKLQGFQAGKGTRLSTFMSTCFRNHFINLAKSKQRNDRAKTSDELEQVVQKQRFDGEQMILVEDILDRESRRGSDMAERVQAFRKYRLEGYTMEEIKQEMGRSVGWVHGCSKSIEQLLRDEMQS